MKLPHKTLEKNLFKSGYRLIYAVDEVGMGCLAGPVVVCAVAFESKFFNQKHKELKGLMESKLLSAKKREEYSCKLMIEKDMKFQIAYAYPKTIDRINIYNASREAMRRVIRKLISSSKYPSFTKVSAGRHVLRKGKILNTKYVIHNTKTIVLVDGPHKISKLNLEQLAIIKGDRKVFTIACASIIAKVHRDKMMTKYAKKYPGYGFEKHKGYGTKHHQAQLTSLGPCEIHRKSFAPVSKLV